MNSKIFQVEFHNPESKSENWDYPNKLTDVVGISHPGYGFIESLVFLGIKDETEGNKLYIQTGTTKPGKQSKVSNLLSPVTRAIYEAESILSHTYKNKSFENKRINNDELFETLDTNLENNNSTIVMFNRYSYTRFDKTLFSVIGKYDNKMYFTIPISKHPEIKIITKQKQMSKFFETQEIKDITIFYEHPKSKSKVETTKKQQEKMKTIKNQIDRLKKQLEKLKQSRKTQKHKKYRNDEFNKKRGIDSKMVEDISPMSISSPSSLLEMPLRPTSENNGSPMSISSPTFPEHIQRAQSNTEKMDISPILIEEQNRPKSAPY